MDPTVRFHAHLAALVVLAVAAVGCTDAESPDGEGTLRVGLWGEGASGESYSLRDAGLAITSDGFDSTISASDQPDGVDAISTPLAAGTYQLELLPGWEVFRGNVDEPMPVQVEAELTTDNPVLFTIADNLATNVTYVFEIGGELVPMSDGTLDIDVAFEEDDGICTNSGEYDWLNVSDTGLDPVGQGEGWQSFTAPTDALLSLVIMFWEAGEYDEVFIVNVYEGVGTSGTLLQSENFIAGDVTSSDFLWFGIPWVPLTEGQTYTIEGVNADGWQTEPGALPGSTSSAGNASHKTMMLQGILCD